MQFIDLQAQRARLGRRLDDALAGVLDHGRYVMGPEVPALESALCDFTGARHAIACANGTDAITLALMAEGLGPGDTVFVPAFTFVATAEAPAQIGVTPYFVDVHRDTFNMDPGSLEAGIADAAARGLRPRAVIAVDLFGQAADYEAINALAHRHGLTVIADAAQSFGGTRAGRPVGTLAAITTTSFFPAKPLGCYGDGGALLTDDDDRAAVLRSLRLHGEGEHRYETVRIGLNSRLDTLQAAVLLAKLSIFADELDARDAAAERYTRRLAPLFDTPRIEPHGRSAWAQYTLIVPEGLAADRAAIQAACRDAGIPTAVYYPIPLNRQVGYQTFPTVPGGVPVSEWLSSRVLSLPMHPYLTAEVQDQICDVVEAAVTQPAVPAVQG